MKNIGERDYRPKTHTVKVRSSDQQLVLKSDLALMLTDLRLTRGWTKRRMAKELDISPSILTKLETGQQLTLWERTWERMLEPLARLLETTPDELERMGKELIAEVSVPQLPGGYTIQTSFVDLLEADPLLDEAGRRFVIEAYERAIGTSRAMSNVG